MDMTKVLTLLANAEAAALDALSERPSSDKAWDAHQRIAAALREVRDALEPVCASPECNKPVTYKGTGRRPRYCEDRCRDRATYLRKTA